MDGLSCLEPQMFDSVFALSLRKFAWAVELPTVNRESVKDLLGIYHFAKMRKGSYLYQKRIEDGRVCICQENVEEDKSKRDKKVTELYHFGLMKSREDVLAMLANFYAFAKYVIKDFDSNPPMLWTALLQMAEILRSPEGRTWGEYHRRHPEAFHNIAMDMQQILNNFTRISSRFEYRKAAQGDLPISVTVYDDAYSQAREYARKLLNVVPQMTLGELGTTLATFSLFQPAAMPTPSPRGQPAPRGRHYDHQSPRGLFKDDKPPERNHDRHHARPHDRQPERHQDRHRQPNRPHPPAHSSTNNVAAANCAHPGAPGILAWGGPGNIPYPPIWVAGTDGKEQKLCANFCFKDRLCRKDNCHFFHARAMSDLPAPALVKLKAWVEAKPMVAFSG
jgi:hypothetical protein